MTLQQVESLETLPKSVGKKSYCCRNKLSCGLNKMKEQSSLNEIKFA